MTTTAQRHAVVRWRDLARWDFKSARAAAFRAAHPRFQPLANFAEEATEMVRPSDEPEIEWPVYGVNNETGVFFSGHQRGDAFNAPYKRIKKDWFFHNPTRANVGSLGRVADVPGNAITSPEYQVWRAKPGTLPEYLEVLIAMPFFSELIAMHRVGAVKERLFVQNLLEIPVPDVPLPAQRKIVAAWETSRTAAAATVAKIKKLERQLNARFLADLGLESTEDAKLPKFVGVYWRNFHRWGVGYNQLSLAGMDLSRSNYELADVDSLAAMVQYGTSEKANTSGTGTAVIRMNNLVDGLLDLRRLKYLTLSERENARLLLKDGDILFNRTNSKELVGKCGVFHEDGEYVFASYLIRVRVKRAIADPDFVAFALNSPIGRQQIDAMSRQIIGQANVNSEELRSLEMPLPPLTIQRQIVKRITKTRDEIAWLKADAKVRADAARAGVEAMILGTQRVEG